MLLNLCSDALARGQHGSQPSVKTCLTHAVSTALRSLNRRAEDTGSRKERMGCYFRVNLTMSQLSPHILGCACCSLKHLCLLKCWIQPRSSVAITTRTLSGRLEEVFVGFWDPALFPASTAIPLGSRMASFFLHS